MFLEKSFQKLLFNSIILILLFFGLITIITPIDGKFMQLELLGFILLLILTLFALFNYHHPRGDFYFYIIFLCYILNLLALWYVNKTFYLSLTFLSLAGFFFSIPHNTSKPKTQKPQPSHNFIFEENPSIPKPELAKTKIAKTPKQDTTIFTNFEQPKETKKITPSPKTNPSVKHIPGKYVASKRSNTYHEPRCEWAKKISESHRLWFKAKEQAWEKGYKAHECVR
ncbi:hypothetical protein HYX11_01250 [Candidatus Woesearchaeota archaeon]|nr:hypothetical protein [Candidatus Woesearchaeota archaeon]